MDYRFVAFVRNTQYPSSDCFKFTCSVSDPEQARSFFSLNRFYVSPAVLKSFLSPRQLSRFKAFYNKPRHYDIFELDIVSYRTRS